LTLGNSLAAKQALVEKKGKKDINIRTRREKMGLARGGFRSKVGKMHGGAKRSEECKISLGKEGTKSCWGRGQEEIVLLVRNAMALG